jgi:hypothetical protein
MAGSRSCFILFFSTKISDEYIWIIDFKKMVEKGRGREGRGLIGFYWVYNFDGFHNLMLKASPGVVPSNFMNSATNI